MNSPRTPHPSHHSDSAPLFTEDSAPSNGTAKIAPASRAHWEQPKRRLLPVLVIGAIAAAGVLALDLRYQAPEADASTLPPATDTPLALPATSAGTAAPLGTQEQAAAPPSDTGPAPLAPQAEPAAPTLPPPSSHVAKAKPPVAERAAKPAPAQAHTASPTPAPVPTFTAPEPAPAPASVDQPATTKAEPPVTPLPGPAKDAGESGIPPAPVQ